MQVLTSKLAPGASGLPSANGVLAASPAIQTPRAGERPHDQAAWFILVLESIFAVAFAYYWILTILYVLPNNFIKASWHGVIYEFGKPFSQKWEFFAPPPTFNFELFVVATPLQTDEEPICLDLLTDLLRAKRELAPFNSSAEALDYILFGCVVGVEDKLGQILSTTYQEHPGLSGEQALRAAHDELRNKELTDVNFAILKRYGLRALRKHADLVTVKNFRIRICKRFLPRFAQTMQGKNVSTPQSVLLL